MEKHKKGDFIVVKTNQPDIHASWMVNSGLTSENIEPSEYVAKIKSVIGDGESYLVYIPIIGFRCVVDKSEVLRRVHEDELTDDGEVVKIAKISLHRMCLSAKRTTKN